MAMLQVYIPNVSSVSNVCYNSFIWVLHAKVDLHVGVEEAKTLDGRAAA
jgi:hypothetical protein